MTVTVCESERVRGWKNHVTCKLRRRSHIRTTDKSFPERGTNIPRDEEN